MLSRPYYEKRMLRNALRCCTHSDVATRIDVVHEKCVNPGCSRRPSYGAVGGKAKWCATHSDVLMVDLVHARCSKPGCSKQPHFGKFCQEHAPLRTFEIGGAQQCLHKGCKRRRAFGLIVPTFCKTHATNEMVYLIKPRCVSAECDALAWYGAPALEATVCARHKRTGMIANPRQRCSHAACNNVGTYDMNSRKSDRFCETHAPNGARALVVSLCGQCGLPDVLNTASLCATCDPVARERVLHAKELVVKEVLVTAGWKYESHDAMLEQGACYSYRPDFVFDAVSHMVVLEVDEHQHASYPAECERTRMLAIAQTFGMPTAFVRYNPVTFVCGLSGRKSFMSNAQRHAQLLLWLANAFNNDDVSGCIVVRVCYDGFATESAAWARVA